MTVWFLLFNFDKKYNIVVFRENIKMVGRKNSKEDVNDSSAESGNSSEDETEPEYVVEKVVDKRITKGKVSYINAKI